MRVRVIGELDYSPAILRETTSRVIESSRFFIEVSRQLSCTAPPRTRFCIEVFDAAPPAVL